MPKKSVLGIRNVKAIKNELFQQIFGKLAMVWQIVFMPAVLGQDAISTDDRERRNAGHAECVEVIAAKEKNGVGFGFIQEFSKLSHGADAGFRLLDNFIRRPRQKMRRMTHAKCCNDFTHRSTPFIMASRYRARA